MTDVVVLPRIAWDKQADQRRFLRACRSAGKTLIYEIDDDQFVHHGWAFKSWEEDGVADKDRPLWRSRKRLIRQCDGVIVSVRRLATLVSAITDKPVHVVPNLIDWEFFTKTAFAAPRQIEGLTIGWAGGRRNEDDVLPMAKAWGMVARDHPEVTFIVQGFLPKSIVSAVPREQLRHIKWLPLETYAQGIRQIDIGCCPLADTPFNRCKSPIKAMEYAAVGAAVVASSVVYRQVVSDGKTGMVADDISDWYGALSCLVSMEPQRRELAAALREHVKANWSLAARAHEWIDAWTSIHRSSISVARSASLVS